MGLKAYLRGEEGWIPDIGGKSTTQSIKDITGAGPNDGWFKGDQSNVTQYIPGFDTGDKKAGPRGWWADFLSPNPNAADAGADAGAQVPLPSIREFNMDDPESVKNLQRRLGVKDDGIFGRKTEAAYRAAVEGERQAANPQGEALDYDYNDAINQGGGGLGGFLKNAYYNLDKRVGGHLPGGQRDSNIMSAEEYENR